MPQVQGIGICEPDWPRQGDAESWGVDLWWRNCSNRQIQKFAYFLANCCHLQEIWCDAKDAAERCTRGGYRRDNEWHRWATRHWNCYTEHIKLLYNIWRLGEIYWAAAIRWCYSRGAEVGGTILLAHGVSWVWRSTTQQGGSALPHRRQEYCRTVADGYTWTARLHAQHTQHDDRQAVDYCSRDCERDSGTTGFPYRCGTRLCVAQSQLGYTFGRWKSAHTPCHPNRVATCECTLHTRRAKHRLAPAR